MCGISKGTREIPLKNILIARTLNNGCFVQMLWCDRSQIYESLAFSKSSPDQEYLDCI